MDLIQFHGVELRATFREGMPFAEFRRLCECLGVDYSSQLKKVSEAHWACMANIATHDSSGRMQNMACMSADTIPMWLATINPKKVSPEIRARLRVFQEEAKEALYRHFGGDVSLGSRRLDLMELSIATLQEQIQKLFVPLAESVKQQNTVLADISRRLEEIDQRTKGKRESINESDKQAIIAVIHRTGGRCPCCQTTHILDECGRRIADVSQFDHWFHRSMCRRWEVWLVCKTCNRKLAYKRTKPGSFWNVKIHAFHAFQALFEERRQMEFFV